MITVAEFHLMTTSPPGPETLAVLSCARITLPLTTLRAASAPADAPPEADAVEVAPADRVARGELVVVAPMVGVPLADDVARSPAKLSGELDPQPVSASEPVSTPASTTSARVLSIAASREPWDPVRERKHGTSYPARQRLSESRRTRTERPAELLLLAPTRGTPILRSWG
jgi:hypothetical protein